jgi:hypothetical protein
MESKQLNTDALTNPHALSDLVEGVRDELEEPPIVIAYAPSWTAEDESVPPPPAELAVPAWTEAEGWIDAESRTVAVLLHAPA